MKKKTSLQCSLASFDTTKVIAVSWITLLYNTVVSAIISKLEREPKSRCIPGLVNRNGPKYSASKVVCGHCLVTFSLRINVTLKWLASLPILMQESFWGWQCSDRYIYNLTFFPLPYHHHPLPVPIILLTKYSCTSVFHLIFGPDYNFFL